MCLDHLAAQVHRGIVMSVNLPSSIQSSDSKRKRIPPQNTCTYQVSYKDGDKKGNAHPDKRWKEEYLAACDWESDDPTSNEETPHAWVPESESEESE